MGRTTLLMGGPGSGKTILGLQFVVHGIQKCREPAIFVAFEETSSRIISNSIGFGWNLAEMSNHELFFLDAQPDPESIQSGAFDLSGLVAMLDAKVTEMKARRIVFDAIDILLTLLPDAMTKQREIYRLHEWLLARGLTGIITAKTHGDDMGLMSQSTGFLQFMVDCGVILNHVVLQGVSQRSLRVQKYRGSAFDENESPFLIGAGGLEVAVARTLSRVDVKVTAERVSSGVQRLDEMMHGGYFRGSSVLLTGFPGTAKTTLCGAFSEAACGRNERTLFVSFDSDGSEVVRNLSSVGIFLEGHVKSGCLRMISARTLAGSAATYLVRIKSLAKEHRARCLVIDPISTLSKTEGELNTRTVIERLIDWAKEDAITLVCTNMLEKMAGQDESGLPPQMSTLADTWIHLSYVVQAGQRNRGMSIIKSRGTPHSNHVRELVLDSTGVAVADPYAAGGDLLMGTARQQKEAATRAARQLAAATAQLKAISLEAEEGELKARIEAMKAAIATKQAEKALLASTVEDSPGPFRV